MDAWGVTFLKCGYVSARANSKANGGGGSVSVSGFVLGLALVLLACRVRVRAKLLRLVAFHLRLVCCLVMCVRG